MLEMAASADYEKTQFSNKPMKTTTAVLDASADGVSCKLEAPSATQDGNHLLDFGLGNHSLKNYFSITVKNTQAHQVTNHSRLIVPILVDFHMKRSGGDFRAIESAYQLEFTLNKWSAFAANEEMQTPMLLPAKHWDLAYPADESHWLEGKQKIFKQYYISGYTMDYYMVHVKPDDSCYRTISPNSLLVWWRNPYTP